MAAQRWWIRSSAGFGRSWPNWWAQYQYTLSDANLDELNIWVPGLLAALQGLPQLKDVSSDQQTQAGAVNMTIDRDAVARFGISPTDIDTAIYNLIGQHQVAQYINQLNSYHIVVEGPPTLQATPELFNAVRLLSPIKLCAGAVPECERLAWEKGPPRLVPGGPHLRV